MRVLVTGGAGFIGSHLVDRLLADRHEVVVLDDCSTGSEQNLAHVDAAAPLRFIRGTVLDGSTVGQAMEGVSVTYHLAAAVGVAHVVRDPIGTIATNVRGTEAVLEQACCRGCRVVFASSSEVYGTSEDLPFREDAPGRLGPTFVRRWCYATSKALDEHLCFGYLDRGLQVSIVRYFNVFGPRMDPAGYGSVIARFLTQAMSGQPLTVHGDGQQSRCFTYVTEAVDATVRAGVEDAAVGEAINVGHRTETTINELARAVLEVVAVEGAMVHVPYESAFGPHFGDTRRRVPDVSKARRILGWEASIALRDGLALTVAATAAGT